MRLSLFAGVVFPLESSTSLEKDRGAYTTVPPVLFASEGLLSLTGEVYFLEALF